MSSTGRFVVECPSWRVASTADCRVARLGPIGHEGGPVLLEDQYCLLFPGCSEIQSFPEGLVKLLAVSAMIAGMHEFDGDISRRQDAYLT